jgi:hypothetical protein
MGCESCEGLESHFLQYEKPNWEPLIEVVGERLAQGFMWMHEEHLSDGTRIHAYKHIHTRRYLYLSEDNEAYELLGCDRLGRDRLDFAIERALCPWWLLAGWEEDDLHALQEALRRTPPSHVWKP